MGDNRNFTGKYGRSREIMGDYGDTPGGTSHVWPRKISLDLECRVSTGMRANIEKSIFEGEQGGGACIVRFGIRRPYI